MRQFLALLLAITILSVTSTAEGQDATSNVTADEWRAFVEARDQATRSEIESLREYLSEFAKSARDINSNQNLDRREKIERVKALREQRDEAAERARQLQRGEAHGHVVLRSTEKGTPIGRLIRPTAGRDEIGATFQYLRVLQVIDDENALVDRVYSRTVYDTRVMNGQVVRTNPRHDTSTRTIWLQHPTEGWVDDQVLRPEGYFTVVGTKRYTTAAGSSNTVPLVAEVDLDELAERFGSGND